LRKGGRLVAYGVHTILTEGKFKALSGILLRSALNLMPDDKVVLTYNITTPKYSTPEWCRDDLSKLLELLAQKKIKPIIADRIPLVEAARAHELLGTGSMMGKFVLTNM
jgi:NADPH2:quinone reductase